MEDSARETPEGGPAEEVRAAGVGEPGRFPAACGGCGYLLHGLGEGVCPECGREFDLSEPVTYVYRGWFNPWWYWWPGVLAAGLSGTAMAAGLMAWGLEGLIPVAVGPAVVGLLRQYGRADVGPGWFLVVTVLADAVACAMNGPCMAAGASVVAVVAMGGGCAVGDWVRGVVKESGWEQGWWLP